MPYDFASAEAETRYNDFLSEEKEHCWRLTDDELMLAEHLFTAPTLQPFAGALDSDARTLDVERVRPLGRSRPTTRTQHLMLMILLSLVTVPHITRVYGGYDPELTELLELPMHDLKVVLEAIAMGAAAA